LIRWEEEEEEKKKGDDRLPRSGLKVSERSGRQTSKRKNERSTNMVEDPSIISAQKLARNSQI
jgi:hypothetical protein